MIQHKKRLVVNGCSYMRNYTRGDGHAELAKLLGIDNYACLSQDGSGNDRIFRSTLRDSYTDIPTLYLIGVTFAHRLELPIGRHATRWVSISGSIMGSGAIYEKASKELLTKLDPEISFNDIKKFFELREKLYFSASVAVLDDLKYRIFMLIDSIKSRGHSVVIFNTAEEQIVGMFRPNDLKYSEIVDDFKWFSNLWQFEQGEPWDPTDESLGLPIMYRHVKSGNHIKFNDYIVDYINKNIND